MVFPPLLMALLTLLPFGISFSDVLSARAYHLTRTVGRSWNAFLFAVICVTIFTLAFYIVYDKGYGGQEKKLAFRFELINTNYILMACWALMLIGLGVTLVTIMAEGPAFLISLFARITAGESATDILYSPQGMMYSQNTPGMLRMFASCSNSACLLWLAAKPIIQRKAKTLWWSHLFIFLALNFIRSVVAGDRSPIISALELTAYILVRDAIVFFRDTPDLKQKWIISAGSVGFLGVGYLAYFFLGQMRGAGSQDYSTLLLYSDLGVANLILSMHTGYGLMFGLNTFLGPLPNLFRGLGIVVNWPIFQADYIWAPPGNFLMNSYWDFGWFGWLNYLALGSLSGWIWKRNCWDADSISWRLGRFYVIYVVSSVFSQGSLGGMDFYIGIIANLIVIGLLKRDHEARHSLAQC